MSRMYNKKRRRRTCLDDMRRRLTDRQRQRRDTNPAGLVLLQLVTTLSAAFAMLPPILMPTFSLPFRHARQTASSIDDDRGPTAYAMERGIEPAYYETNAPMPKPRPSWARLVKDLKRPRVAARAREEIESRVPLAALEWLREAIDTGEYWQLYKVGRQGATEAEIAVAALDAADAWKAERQQVQDAPADVEPSDDDPDNARGPNR
jgi:hypothetical protein